jgi:hypothetical protein
LIVGQQGSGVGLPNYYGFGYSQGSAQYFMGWQKPPNPLAVLSHPLSVFENVGVGVSYQLSHFSWFGGHNVHVQFSETYDPTTGRITSSGGLLVK